MKTLKRVLALWLVMGMLLSMFGEAEERHFAEAQLPGEAQVSEASPESEDVSDEARVPEAPEEPSGDPEEAPLADGGADAPEESQADQTAELAGESEALSAAGFLMDGDELVVYEGAGGDVIIPDGIRIIGPMAFCELPELRGVVVPASVERIESYAFANCENLEAVFLSEGLTAIGDHAFEGCANLREIVLPDGLASIGEGAFQGCAALRDVTLPESVISVGEAAFPESSPAGSAEAATSEGAETEQSGATDAAWPMVQSGIEYIDELTLGVEESFTPEVRYTPASDEDALSFSSDNSAIARVDSQGKITGVSKGETTINVRAESGASASCHVTVLSAPKNISFDKKYGVLGVGQTMRLEPILSEGSASHQILWKSGWNETATVDNGVVTARQRGITEITATTFNGKRASFTLTVHPAAEAVRVAESLKLCVNQPPFEPKVALEPENARSDIEITSDDTNVVAVEGGKLVARQTGSATVTVTARNGESAVSAQCAVTVVEAPTEIRIANPVESLGVKEIYTFSAELAGDEALGAYNTWSSDKLSVLKVLDAAAGRFQAVKKGTATVSVVSANGLRDEITVRVLSAPTKLTLSEKKGTLGIGETLQLTAKLSKNAASQIQWASDDAEIATVEDGCVTALSEGSVRISATTFNKKKAVYKLTVKKAPDGIGLHGALTLGVGQSYTLKLALSPADAASRLTIANGDDSVVKLDKREATAASEVNLKLKALSEGSSRIEIETYNGLRAACEVTVCAAPKKIEIANAVASLGVGEQYQLRASCDRDDALLEHCKWKSSNKKILQVDPATGMLTAKKKGKAKITVTLPKGKKTIKRSVTIRVVGAPDGVTLNKTHADMKVGEVLLLSAMPFPAKAASQILWSSGNEDVATVSGDGRVMAVGGGETTITAQTFNGKSAGCSVSVDGLRAPVIRIAGARAGSDLWEVCDDVELSWSSAEDSLESFDVRITGDDGSELLRSEATSDTSATIEGARMQPGVIYTISVTARMRVDGELASRSSEARFKFVESSEFSYEISEDGATVAITGYSGAASALTVPARLAGGRVARIAAGAFNGANCARLTSVIWPEGVVFEANSVAGLKGCADEAGLLICNGILCEYFGSASSVSIPAGVTRVNDGAFEGNGRINRVELPGTVESIGARAFAGSALEEIHLPASINFIADDAFDGPERVRVTADKGSYAYNWAVAHGYIEAEGISISVGCSAATKAEIGQSVLWIAEASGGVGAFEYRFELMKDGALFAEQDYGPQNYFMFEIKEGGSYSLKAYCRDEVGEIAVAMSNSLAVAAPTAQILSVRADVEYAVEGDVVAWTVVTNGEAEPVEYRYELWRDDACVVEQDYAQGNTYSCAMPGAGNFVLRVRCRDTNGGSDSFDAPEILVYSRAEAYPAAPELIFEEGIEPFSREAASAPEYAPQRFRLSWARQDGVSDYRISVDRSEGGSWRNLYIDEGCVGTSFDLSAELFDDLKANALHRFSISAKGMRTGEAAEYYFVIVPPDESIAVNGATSLRWDQNSKFASIREFTVRSDLEWEAESDADWITCSRDGEILSVALRENGTGYERSGKVTISNGANSASITIRQSYASEAPSATWPRGFSTDASRPSDYPVGEFTLSWDDGDNSYARLRVYEIASGGSERLIYTRVTSNAYCYLDEASIGEAFKAGSTYRFELAGIYSSSYDKNEAEGDLLKRSYYVRMTSGGHSVTVNGKKALTYYNALKIPVFIAARNYASITTDADWLSVNLSALKRFEGDGKYATIQAESNDSGARREGHAYFTCGSATATVTVIQDDMSPKILFPENLSQDENHPTVIYMDKNELDTNYYYLVYQGRYLYMERYSNGAYEEKKKISTNSQYARSEAKLKTADVTSASYIRFTAINGDASTMYYATFLDAERYYDSFSERYLSLNVSAEAHSDEAVFYSVCGWTARSDASWLVPAARSGSGNGYVELSFHVDANTTGQPRTGRLIIESTQDDSVLWIDINQAAEEYVELYWSTAAGYVKHDPAVHNAKVYDGSQCQTATIKAYAPCEGRIQCGADWIHSSTGSYFDSGESFTLKLDANSPDGGVRTGTVTVSCGSKEQTITIKQAPGIGTAPLSSPALSTDYKNPSVVKYEDIKLTWPAMKNAARYKLNLYGNAQNWEVFEKTIESDGSSQYSCIIPKECLEMDSTEYQHICLRIDDQYDNYVIQHYYIIASRGDKVLLNGSDAPVWENAPDYNASESYTVQSSANWTAAASQSWIHLDTWSGASGGAFTVTLDENLSASPRSGQVTVTSGGGSTVLRIGQCAYFAEQRPSLISPQYSKDKAIPTIVSPMDSLTVTWKPAPQAKYYEIELTQCEANNRASILEDSGRLKNGEASYTFGGLKLEAGALYSLQFKCYSNRWHGTRTSYYFTLSDENAWVKVDGAALAEMEADGDEDYSAYDITSSGYWTAQTDDRWLLLYGRRMDQAELDESETLPEDYARYGSVSGNRLYISALANATGKPRTGTVTVRCGSASATIRVYQFQRYSIAALTSPQLSETSASPTKLPYGDVNLRWSSASGGTGRYMVKVEESDKPRTGYNTVVLKKEGLTSTSCTIPVGKLSEGKYYRVFLGTEITAEECPGQSYYFQLSYENELAVTARLVSGSVDLGRAISVYATATGGSGGYVYTYALYSGDTELMRSAPFEGQDFYTFPTTQPGKYHVVVWVQDSSGETAQFDTGAVTVSDVPDYVYIGDAASASAELPSAGGSLTRTVRSKSNWIWSCDQSWLQIDATGAANSSLTVSASANATGAPRQATVYVASGDARATLTVTQHQSSSLECVPSALSFSNATGSDSVSVTSSGAWTASASDPWIQISKASGVSGDRVVVTVSENAGSARSGSVRFSCGEQSRTVAVNQSASSATRVTRVYGVAPVQTGEETNLSVYAENAVYVRMIVDGVELADQYSVNEFGVAYVRYKFSQSGKRKLEFSACGYDGVWTQPDPALAAVLDVTAPNGTLDPVRFGALQEKYNRGDSVTLSWSDSGKAENYVAYVYKDDALLKKVVPGEGGMTKNSLALSSAELSQAGHYNICVMTTGKGYDQSSSATSFDIQYEAYLHCKSAALYNDAEMSSYRGGLRFGDKYTVESEQTTALGMQIARIRDAKGTVGYCDATLLGEEYWHPCLKDGVLVHTFNGKEQHRPEHPHKKYRVCTVCDEEVDILGPDGQPTYTMPIGSSSANCCDCGNHTFDSTMHYSDTHPHKAYQECVNCHAKKELDVAEAFHSGCPTCEGYASKVQIEILYLPLDEYVGLEEDGKTQHNVDLMWRVKDIPEGSYVLAGFVPSQEGQVIPLSKLRRFNAVKSDHNYIARYTKADFEKVDCTYLAVVLVYNSAGTLMQAESQGLHICRDYETYRLRNNPSDFEEVFSGPATSKYDRELLKQSIEGSLQAYNMDNAKNLLAKLGFTEIKSYNYPDSQKTDAFALGKYVAFTIGNRMIVDVFGVKKRLYAILIRGTKDDVEWVDDFDVGDSTYAQGFTFAACDVCSCFDRYLERYGDGSEDYKLWITGHSRGGAVANLLAGRYFPLQGVEPSDIYAYTFACPNVAKKDHIANNNNVPIFNFIYFGDLIPNFPLTDSGWDYGRFGQPDIRLDQPSGISVNTVGSTGRLIEFIHSKLPTPEVYMSKAFPKIRDEILASDGIENIDAIPLLVNILGCWDSIELGTKYLISLGWDYKLVGPTHVMETYKKYYLEDYV